MCSSESLNYYRIFTAVTDDDRRIGINSHLAIHTPVSCWSKYFECVVHDLGLSCKYSEQSVDVTLFHSS